MGLPAIRRTVAKKSRLVGIHPTSLFSFLAITVLEIAVLAITVLEIAVLEITVLEITVPRDTDDHRGHGDEQQSVSELLLNDAVVTA